MEDRLSWQFFVVVVVVSVVCVCKRERENCLCVSVSGRRGRGQGWENVCIPSVFQLDFAGRLKRLLSLLKHRGRRVRKLRKSPSRVTAAGVSLQK